MPIEHPSPTEATAKYLYAHAFRCAYEGCRRPLYRVDEQTGVRSLNSRVCHINARREGGPRWDPAQSAEDNGSEKNLVLMCVEHASAIDEPTTLAVYPADLLRQWKAKQLEEYDQIKQGWILDTKMALDAIEASALNAHVIIQNSTVELGGRGGNAPSAGGGGGGAIGRAARAGQGGPGGARRIEGDKSLPFDDEADGRLRGQLGDVEAGKYPGAGGGGAGAIGDGAVAGDGGGGGEHVSAIIDINELNDLRQRPGLSPRRGRSRARWARAASSGRTWP